ncbi:hypothetical protein CDAR_527531 [Caerostris darwini]|uniref:Uncharacterized protein n=1 Tax=Caerostris darwini TaxID=1538125 RepID=A0AAV4R9P7_9ARAC|nr:hypothetical protein CDAR_527531 [Caerostris darwini]
MIVPGEVGKKKPILFPPVVISSRVEIAPSRGGICELVSHPYFSGPNKDFGAYIQGHFDRGVFCSASLARFQTELFHFRNPTIYFRGLQTFQP